MTTLTPREPYSKEELERLYPKNLKLQLVQVVSIVFSGREKKEENSWLTDVDSQFLRHGTSLLECYTKS